MSFTAGANASAVCFCICRYGKEKELFQNETALFYFVLNQLITGMNAL